MYLSEILGPIIWERCSIFTYLTPSSVNGGGRFNGNRGDGAFFAGNPVLGHYNKDEAKNRKVIGNQGLPGTGLLQVSESGGRAVRESGSRTEQE